MLLNCDVGEDSWKSLGFLKRQVRWSGIPISFRIFQFIVIHAVKGFGIVNKQKQKQTFSWNSLAYYACLKVGIVL